EQGRVTLGAEWIGFARAARRALAADGELDRLRGIEHDEGGDPLAVDTEERGDALRRQAAGVDRPAVGRGIPEDDVEGDVVHSGVLGPDRRREFGEPHLVTTAFLPPRSVSVRNRPMARTGSWPGGSSVITWLSVHS